MQPDVVGIWKAFLDAIDKDKDTLINLIGEFPSFVQTVHNLNVQQNFDDIDKIVNKLALHTPYFLKCENVKQNAIIVKINSSYTNVCYLIILTEFSLLNIKLIKSLSSCLLVVPCFYRCVEIPEKSDFEYILISERSRVTINLV